ncbi:C39 family peptidase [Pelomonas sp. CA6]|uniref:C39 family peptidase n=1 Tax=Pelomonas sp. CA6 TaxID=2907999 RepID=UPI001F4B8092|nr:C39 family peptidase [Pelomonas sp. CA6]MCH7342013.1 C39 family peptidase [Pelomonas sp. CA6]
MDARLDRGLYLQVHAQVDEWLTEGSLEASLRAVRAMRYLGADRAGDALALRLGRRYRDSLRARVVALRTVLGRRGAYAFWRAQQAWPQPPAGPPDEQAELLSLQGIWQADLRDFERARACHDQALALAPDDPWLHIELSYTLTRQDLYEQALARAQQALALCPGYRAAIQQVASLYMLTQRRDEALALLADAAQHSECSALHLQLHDLYAEYGEHERALACIDEAQRCMPRAEAATRGGLAARRADLLMRLDRLEEAREQAEQVPGTGYYAQLAERLRTPPKGHSRVLLSLEFVRQHWSTCAPATLAALSRYWGRPAEHLEIAEAICYDGTADVSERCWAQDQGFVVREFRLDWPTACQLLDAGLPFALVTLQSASGHLQAVVGYDRLRNTLLIRDPYLPVHTEFEAGALVEAQRAQGPRALLLVPPEEVHRLQGLVLPEAEDWDLLHAMQAALERHDRGAALEALERLRGQAPGSRLAWRAARQLAAYDGNEPQIHAATDALLQMFPGDAHLQLSKVASLAELEGQALAESYMEAAAAPLEAEPLLLARLAERLSQDARRLPRAWALMRQALRRQPAQGRLWWQWADLLWREGRQQASLAPYRWAACLMPTDEGAAKAYARACWALGRVDEGLEFLRQREATWGDRSSAPAMTWHEQLDQLEKTEAAEQVLAAALRRRSDDAGLKLYAAEDRLRRQRLAEAQALLDAATEPARRGSRLRVSALLSEARGDYAQALAWAQEAASLEPFNLAQRRLHLRLVARLQGRDAAIAELRAVVARHPAHYGLNRLLYDWLPDRPQAINEQLAHMLQHHPQDVWLRRECAVQASRQGRHDDALREAQAAHALGANRADTQGTLAFVLLRREGYAAALPALRRSVELDVDYDYGMRTLVMSAPDAEAARQAVDHVARELERQVVLGDGLLCFQSVASRGWDPEAVEAVLRRVHAARPEVWEAWVALGRQLLEMGRSDAAHEVLVPAASRFTGLPRVQFELADVLRQLGLREEALQANARALAMSPGWNRAVRLQVELIQEIDADWAAMEPVLQRALQLAFEDDDLIALLAWVHEKQQRDAEALALCRRSLLLNPRPNWIWAMARRICARAERLVDFDALLEDVVRSRPGDAWAWTVQAEQLRDDEQALAAAAEALRLDPLLESAWLARFERLARLSRYAEIEALLQDLPWPGEVPVSVRAWGARCAWRRDEKPQAVRLLRDLVQQQRDDGLWRELADWEDELGHDEAYLEAAQQLLQLLPHRALSHLYLGHALHKLKRQEEALAPLRRALELEPTYVFAAHVLCRVAEALRRPDEAEWALQTLWPHEPTVRTATLGVEAACRAELRERALAWLDRLCGCNEYDCELTQQACAQLVAAGWGDVLRERQLDGLRRGSGPTGLVVDWLRHQADRRGVLWTGWRAGREMRQARGTLLQRGLLRWLVEGEHDLLLRGFLWRHAAALRADEVSWGEVSYALLSRDMGRTLIRWMKDWRQRPQAPVWALSNYCVALAQRRRWREVAEVVDAGLPRSPYQEDMRFWQLVLLAGQGPREALEHALARQHEWTPDPWMRHPLKVVHAYVELWRQQAAAGTVSAFRRSAEGGGETTLAIWRRLRLPALFQHTPLARQWRWWWPGA